MGSETLPSACYILSDESSIPFYSTSNGYNNIIFKEKHFEKGIKQKGFFYFYSSNNCCHADPSFFFAALAESFPDFVAIIYIEQCFTQPPLSRLLWISSDCALVCRQLTDLLQLVLVCRRQRPDRRFQRPRKNASPGR